MTVVAATSTTVDIDVESIAAGGDGVGRAEGLVVFVPRTAPGDRARVRMATGKRFARGSLETLLSPSVTRVDPPCAHYVADRCGGCQLQHMGYEAQLAAKSGIVRDALQRIGKRESGAPEVVPSPRQWRYRAKLTLAMRATSRGWVMGLHPYDAPGEIFQLVDCPITDERVVDSWREIMAAAIHLPRADELRGSIRIADRGAVAVIEGGREWARADAFFQAVPSLTALWWAPEGARRRLVVEREHAHAGASFSQINPGVADVLRAYILDRARAHRPATVVDAYAGVGDTAVPLAQAGARVTAIELDRDAAARCTARLPAGSRVLAGRVEDLLPRAVPADVILVNPPRAGLDEQLTTFLQQRQPLAARALLYISCNPATLARDLSRLSAYRLASVRSFDMFPQTAHVETVCELVADVA